MFASVQLSVARMSLSSSSRSTFLHHIAGGISDPTHRDMLERTCCYDMAWMTHLDYVYGAAGIAARERWPLLGLSVTRRSLNLLCLRYNDATMQCLSCFVCGQLRTTCQGYPGVDLNTAIDDSAIHSYEIKTHDITWFDEMENASPGTLLNNCNYELWRHRYVLNTRQAPTKHPWQ